MKRRTEKKLSAKIRLKNERGSKEKNSMRPLIEYATRLAVEYYTYKSKEVGEKLSATIDSIDELGYGIYFHPVELASGPFIQTYFWKDGEPQRLFNQYCNRMEKDCFDPRIVEITERLHEYGFSISPISSEHLFSEHEYSRFKVIANLMLTSARLVWDTKQFYPTRWKKTWHGEQSSLPRKSILDPQDIAFLATMGCTL